MLWDVAAIVAEVRYGALAEVAERLAHRRCPSLQCMNGSKARVLTMRRLRDCVADFAALLPAINALGGEDAVRRFGRSPSIALV
jgi:hypothetical protein